MQMGTTLPNARASIGVQATLKWLGSRRLVLAGIALGVIGAGLAWQWSWLIAIGIAPLLVSVAPCVAMCALGLCMGFRGSSAASGNAARKVATAAPQLLDHTQSMTHRPYLPCGKENLRPCASENLRHFPEAPRLMPDPEKETPR